MARKEVVVQGENLEEALKRGAIKLGVTPEDLSHEILVEGRKGLFGAKGRPFEVKVYVSSGHKEESSDLKYDKLLEEIADHDHDLADAGVGADGYCTVEINDDGVFLTVSDPVGTGQKLSLEQASTSIESQGIQNVDWEEVERACELAHGVPVKIAEYDPILYREAQILIDLSPDDMKAYLTLSAPQGGRVPDYDRVVQALHEAGVVVGIDEEALRLMLSTSTLNEKTTVAEGIQPTTGKDAEIKQRFRNIRGRQTPDEDEEEGGRVDFKSLHIVQNVTKGEPLAEKIPAVLGEKGRTVTGREIKAVMGRDIELTGGQNTRVSEDGLLLTSTIDGHVAFTGKVPLVLAVFDVKGDVDYSVGNIDFIGDIRIKGSVFDDFTVKAKGSIYVGGSVQSAILEATGSVVVKGGVIGKGRGLVKADEDIVAHFADDAILDARRDVIVHNEIMHSQVMAGEKVEVTGKKAVIVGGKVMAGTSIESKSIGSIADVKTEVHVGVDPRLIQEYNKLDSDLGKYEKSIVEIEHSINIMTEKQEVGKLPPEKIQLLQEWLTKRKQIKELIEDLIQRLGDLEHRATLSRGGLVKVSKVLFPGTVVHIRTAYKKITEEIRFTTLSYDQGEIRIGPYA